MGHAGRWSVPLLKKMRRVHQSYGDIAILKMWRIYMCLNFMMKWLSEEA